MMLSQMSIEGGYSRPFASPRKPGRNCDTSGRAAPKSPRNESKSTASPKSPRSCLSTDSQDERQSGSDVVASGTAAIDFYENLVREAKESGLEVREVLEKSYSDVDWRQFVPRDEDGQLMSLGSIPHATDPCGKNCKPCGCFRKGKCYKLEQCMYCHFVHPARTFRSEDPLKKETSKHRRERRRRNAYKKYGDEAVDDAADYVEKAEKLQPPIPKHLLNADQPSTPKVIVPGPKSKARGMFDGSGDYVKDLPLPTQALGMLDRSRDYQNDLQSATLKVDWSSPPKVISPVAKLKALPWRTRACESSKQDCEAQPSITIRCEFTKQELEASYDNGSETVSEEDGPSELYGIVSPRVCVTPPPENMNLNYGMHPDLVDQGSLMWNGGCEYECQEMANIYK